MRLGMAVLTLALGINPALAQNDFSKVKIETTTLAKRVHVLFGAGGNVGIFIGDERTLIVDDQFAQMAPRIENTVRNIKKQPIDFLINTHWHGDHSGGNEYFGQAGAVIIAHDNAHKRLSTQQKGGFSGATIEPAAAIARPKVTYSETSTLHESGETIKLVHLRKAHTDGDTMVIFKKANVAHMGDVYFEDRWPYIDRNSGGSIDGMVRALRYGASLLDAETVVIPGHGPISDRKGMLGAASRLAAIADQARAVKAAGGDLTAFKASDPTVEYPRVNETSGESWTDKFLEIAFSSATE